MKKMRKDNDKRHREERKLHNAEMVKLALEWNCLEVVKDLVVRGSIDNIEVNMYLEILDKFIEVLRSNTDQFR